MAYVKSIHDVKEVKETCDIQEVNEKIKDGWMLLTVAKTSHSEVLFSLGRF